MPLTIFFKPDQTDTGWVRAEDTLVLEARVAELEAQAVQHNGLLDLIQGQCGIPDPADACRAILSTINVCRLKR